MPAIPPPEHERLKTPSIGGPGDGAAPATGLHFPPVSLLNRGPSELVCFCKQPEQGLHCPLDCTYLRGVSCFGLAMHLQQLQPHLADDEPIPHALVWCIHVNF